MAVDFWMHAFATGLVRIDSDVLDLGCGCGRFAIVLRRLNHKGWKFAGTYTGIDVDQEMIRWCQRHFPADRFRFIWTDQYSQVYNPTDRAQNPHRLPLEDDSPDFVFSTSLLTHLLDDDLTNYLVESYRVLRDGGTMHMSVFCIEYLRRAARHRRTFEHRAGPAFVANPDRPEAAVAFPEAHLLQRCRQAGFRTVHVEPDGGQHTLVAVK